MPYTVNRKISLSAHFNEVHEPASPLEHLSCPCGESPTSSPTCIMGTSLCLLPPWTRHGLHGLPVPWGSSPGTKPSLHTHFPTFSLFLNESGPSLSASHSELSKTSLAQPVSFSPYMGILGPAAQCPQTAHSRHSWGISPSPTGPSFLLSPPTSQAPGDFLQPRGQKPADSE